MAARPAKQLSARDRRRYEDLKRAREEQYKHALSRLSPLLLSVFLLSILLLALFFCDLSYIHNTDVGREVSVSFWSYALATVSGSFSSPAAVFGDIAVPFYYYAETGTVLTGILSLVLVIAALALAVLSAVVFLRRKYDLLPLLLFAAGVTVLLLFGSLISSLALNSSQILPVYYAIVAAVKYHSARDILSGKRPVRAGGAA